MRMRDLNVVMMPPSALEPYGGNPRTHSQRQIKQVACSIKMLGWTNPILIDSDHRVIAGHGRLKAAQFLSLREVPVIRITDMTPAEVRAYVLADNKLAELAGWDREVLALELQGLFDLEPDFDFSLTGFEMGEIDLIIADLDEDERDLAETLPPPGEDLPLVTRPGDIWLLGRHRLLCADATDGMSLRRLMGGAEAQVVITDPPYNVPIAGHASGLGVAAHGNFAMASGEMSEAEFTAFLRSVLGAMASQSCDGAIHFVFIDWRHLFELLSAAREVYSDTKNVCVWTKTNAGMGSLYRSQHELIGVFKVGSAPHINNVELGRHGRNRSNVWSYPGMSSFGRDREQVLAMHPTVKPVALVEDAIYDCSNRDGIVLDAFAGSGTTLIAAERAGRRAFGIEIDPHYVDVALRRFKTFTGIEPIQGGTRLRFDQVEQAAAAARCRPADACAEDNKREPRG